MWSRSGWQPRAAFSTTRWSHGARAIPSHTGFINAKVTALSTGPERQIVGLSNGDAISTRLVVLATGLNIGFRSKLGIDHEVMSANHSISAGFDVVAADGNAFAFSALTYFAERPSDQMA